MRKIILVFIAAVLLMTGCGGGGRQDSSEGGDNSSKMGRFVEEQLELIGEVNRAYGASLIEDDLVFIGLEIGAEERYYKRHVRDENGVLTSTEPESLKKLAATGYTIMNISEGPDGTMYAYVIDDRSEGTFTSADDFGSAVMKSVDGGDFEKVEVSELNSRAEGVYPSTIIAVDGGFLIQFLNRYVKHFTADGTFVRDYPGGYNSNTIAVYGNSLAVTSETEDEIIVYDLTSGDIQYTADIPGLEILEMGQLNGTIGIDGEGLFTGSPSGIFRWRNDAWEIEVDGAMTSLVNPDMAIGMLAAHNGEYIAFLGNNSLMRYWFNPDVPAEATEALEIFSLYDNATIRKAIGEFRRAYPNVRVDLRVAMDDAESATTEDVIRALNTELVAGRGPDLIVLDGLPVDSYIDKGVLKDLSGIVAKLTPLGLMENMANTYEREGKVYGLPSRFTVPVILGKEELIDQIDSIESLAEMTNELQTAEPAFLRYPDNLFGEFGMMMDYYDACEETFYTEDGSIDAATLEAWFDNMLTLTNVLKENAPEVDNRYGLFISMAGSSGSEAVDMGVMDIGDGKALAHIQTMIGFPSLTFVCQTLNKLEGMALNSLFGWNKFYPAGGIGVLASGERTELAEAFITTLMSRDVQDKYLFDGFPVNSLSMQAGLDEYTSEMADGELDYMGFIELCEALSRPAFTNSVVKDAVSNQVKNLLEGTTNPAEAAAAVVADTRLHLAE